MQKLAELNSAAAAQTFADYCLQQGWQVSVAVQSAEHAELYVAAEAEAAVAAELEQFIAQPWQPKYRDAAWHRSEPAAQSGSLGLAGVGRNMLRQSGPVVWLLGLAAILVFLAQQIWPQSTFMLFRIVGEDGLALFSYRWWSPMLLHFSASHLMFNLLALWIFAGRLELTLGSRWLLLLVLCSGFASNLAQLWVSGPNFGGLSGVVYAVFGFLWLYGWRYPQQPLRLSKVDLTLALGFMALGFADLLWVNTANWAHLVGLVCGMVLALLAPRR